MGFKMEDIHSPTVPSGSAGNPSAQAGSEEKSTMMELFAEKDRLEGELTALGGVLESVCMLIIRIRSIKCPYTDSFSSTE